MQNNLEADKWYAVEEELKEATTDFYLNLAAKQVTLGNEIRKILYNNLQDAYVN